LAQGKQAGKSNRIRFEGPPFQEQKKGKRKHEIRCRVKERGERIEKEEGAKKLHFLP